MSANTGTETLSGLDGDFMSVPKNQVNVKKRSSPQKPQQGLKIIPMGNESLFNLNIDGNIFFFVSNMSQNFRSRNSDMVCHTLLVKLV